jgi:hypothetical protein
MSGTFTCDNCGGTFGIMPGRTEDVVRAEHDAQFPEAAAATREQLVRVCDVCFAAFNRWFNALPPDKREAMRAESRAKAGKPS